MQLAAIATLQDALAYPQQSALLGALRPPSLTAASAAKKRKPRTKRAPIPRKKFPPALARFRDRLQFLEERLRLDVNALRQEVSDLERHRTLLDARALSTRYRVDGAAAQLVREYFVIFTRGFQRFPEGDGADVRAMRLLHATGGSGSGDTLALLPSPLRALHTQIEDASKQQAFLEAAMDPELTFHRFVGRDVLVDQWQRYSQYHDSLCMHVDELEVVAKAASQRRPTDTMIVDEDYEDDARRSAVVYVIGRLTARVTQATLEQIFPHVLRNRGLALRLLGAVIEYPFRVEFHVTADGRCITTYDADVDFVAALSGVLGNLDDVTLLMRDALISEFCMIGRVEAEHVEDAPSHEDDVKDDEAKEEAEEAPTAAGVVSKAAIDYILS
ncbi:hypothetical protein PybrP1_004316 [[Pythium] brassicae (nom. inval.)]|nr:hypothetical protein PybrP1_004316 [[Pythium] brassicae (nom. inval.)]